MPLIALFDTYQGAFDVLEEQGCPGVEWASLGWPGRGDGTHLSLFRDPRAVPFIDAFGRRYGTPVREIGPYFCFLPLKFDAKEENLVPGPAAARFSPHAKYASAFQSYADLFGDSMRWDASWDLSQSRN